MRKKSETAAVAESIETADGFAQVFPEHKYHIIDVLQQRGHIVGMTGDGVNDAPALKKADCGIAVSGATDAARAAADIVLLTPGLSVIIEAIKQSRKIFQRMNSYAMYRITETLRVLLFMTVAILVFNFYPLTAIMIVMLALLNDGAILSIAYDNVHYRNEPEAWNMRLVLGISTVLGVIGPIAAFGLFYLGDRVFDLGHPRVQTLMYLMLSVAGHLTIFLTRTRGPFWSIRPARILLIAVLRHPGHRHPHRRLRAVHGPTRVEMGRRSVDLRTGLVPDQRPHQTPRLPHPRPGEEGEETSEPVHDLTPTRDDTNSPVGQPRKGPTSQRHVSSRHRLTIEKIFHHPAGGTIAWRQVLSPGAVDGRHAPHAQASRIRTGCRTPTPNTRPRDHGDGEWETPLSAAAPSVTRRARNQRRIGGRVCPHSGRGRRRDRSVWRPVAAQQPIPAARGHLSVVAERDPATRLSFLRCLKQHGWLVHSKDDGLNRIGTIGIWRISRLTRRSAVHFAISSKRSGLTYPRCSRAGQPNTSPPTSCCVSAISSLAPVSSSLDRSNGSPSNAR